MKYVGIDPGRKTGLAICHGGKLTTVTTSDFWTVARLLNTLSEKASEYTIVIEDPAQIKPVFPREIKVKDPKKRKAIENTIAQRVGRNKEQADRLIELAQYLQFKVITVKPTESKWSEQTFKNMTGWEKRTSQHGRDAGHLLIGRQ